MIRRTVQVKQYEPTTIELSVSGECDKDRYVAERDIAYSELKAKMNDIFNPSAKSSCLD
jgi:hypothetical protein